MFTSNALSRKDRWIFNHATWFLVGRRRQSVHSPCDISLGACFCVWFVCFNDLCSNQHVFSRVGIIVLRTRFFPASITMYENGWFISVLWSYFEVTCAFWFVTFHLCFDSLHPINNISVIKGQVFLVWTSIKLWFMFLLKDTTQWRQCGSNLRPLGLESSILPLSTWILRLCAMLKLRRKTLMLIVINRNKQKHDI